MKFAPAPVQVDVKRVRRQIDQSDLKQVDHVIILLPAGISDTALAKAPFATALKVLRGRAHDPNTVLNGTVQTRRQVGLTVATLPASPTVFTRLTLARKVVASVLPARPQHLAIVSLEKNAGQRGASASALVAGVFAAAGEMPAYKAKTPPPCSVQTVTLFGIPAIDLARLRVEARANHLARWLTAQPPNKLDARALIEGAVEMARQRGYEHHVYDEAQLAGMGANAFLAVSRANAHSDAGIVHLRRRGTGAHVALVGKGVCYDTGGINVKPANYMAGMHTDMEGSAVALAAFLALCELAPEMDLECFLAVTENRISSAAYTPNEVVTAMNGTTIEVIHSDAEGRMALADTLVLASRNKPQVIFDYATLTGTCISALTTLYSGVFTNRDHLHPLLIEAGRQSGERIWPFPMDSDYDAGIESKQADIQQCSSAVGGDHIRAARFLGRFIEGNIPWVHMDLSAGTHKGGLAHIPTDINGFGVLVTTQLILDQGLVEHLDQ